MTDTVVQERNLRLEEYLQLLYLLSFEQERAIEAITHNSLTTFEDSVVNQQAFSTQLSELSQNLVELSGKGSTASSALPDDALMHQILCASEALRKLNRRYATLLEYFSYSTSLMVSLYRSFQGQLGEGSGARAKQQTWSCQI